jgi:hypothetical protein
MGDSVVKLKALAFMALMTGCSPAMAQEVTCWDRPTFLTIVYSHQAQLVGYGLNYAGNMIEVWVRGDQEFLVTSVMPNMTTCLATYGIAWTKGEEIKYGEPG